MPRWVGGLLLLLVTGVAWAGRPQVKASPTGDWTFPGAIKPLCVKAADLALSTNLLPNGFELCCSDCATAVPCTGGGTGTIAKRYNDVWDCTGGGGGAGTVTGIAGDTGGTTTGATVTIAGGAGVATSRSADVITVVTASTETNFLTPAGSDLTCGASTAGKDQVRAKEEQYCDNTGTPVLRRNVSISALPSGSGQIIYFVDATSAAVLNGLCTYLGDTTPGFNCPANTTTGGILAIYEDADFGTSLFGFSLGSTNLGADHLFTPDANGKISGSQFLQPVSVTNAEMDKGGNYGAFDGYFDLTARSTPPTNPGAGVIRTYTKINNGVCGIDQNGVEKCTGTGSGGGGGSGVVLGFGTGMLLTAGTGTYYGGMGTFSDTVEGIVQVPVPAGTWRNLRCVPTATPGGSGIAATVRVGACGSQADAGSPAAESVTVTTANTQVADTTNVVTTTAGQCLDLKFVKTSTTTAAAVGCTMEFSPIGIISTGTGMTLSPGAVTRYMGLGLLVDPTENIVQVPSPGATYQNLRCTASATPGGSGIVVTMRSGACGSQGDSTATVTLTTANTTVSDTTHPVVVTAGQCVDFKVATVGPTTTAAAVGCTMERVL